MTEKELRCRELRKEGYNCCQAVVGAFAEEIGMEFETLMKLSSSFGGGVAGKREVCGAVSGMAMVLGLLYSNADPKTNKAQYELTKKEIEKFEEENGKIVCRELLAMGKKPCNDLVADATNLVNEYIKNS